MGVSDSENNSQEKEITFKKKNMAELFSQL